MKIVRKWSFDNVRHMCVTNALYEHGTNKDFEKMLVFVMKHEPTEENILLVARDIEKHSSEWNVEELVYLILHEACFEDVVFEHADF